MSNLKNFFTFCLLLVASLLLFECAEEKKKEEKIDLKDVKLEEKEGGCIEDVFLPSDVPQCEKLQNDITGYYYRVTKLTVERPGDEWLKSVLTTLWNNDIKDDRLIILFKITKHDQDKGEIIIKASAGKKDGENYAFKTDPPPTEIKLIKDDCYFKTFEKAKLYIFPDTTNIPIPIVDLFAKVIFSEDGKNIQWTYLDGAIIKEEADKIIFELPVGDTTIKQNFGKFMDDAKIYPNKDINCDGKLDSYSFSGYLEGEKITNVVE